MGGFTRFKHWLNKFGELIDQPIIVSTNLDGFSLVNHGQFGKFVRLSLCHYTVQLEGWSFVISYLAIKFIFLENNRNCSKRYS